MHEEHIYLIGNLCFALSHSTQTNTFPNPDQSDQNATRLLYILPLFIQRRLPFFASFRYFRDFHMPKTSVSQANPYY